MDCEPIWFSAKKKNVGSGISSKYITPEIQQYERTEKSVFFFFLANVSHNRVVRNVNCDWEIV